ncbi:MAG TPA: SbcC/MukB-like Walker B domain-containing protein [Aldersonia sp.]
MQLDSDLADVANAIRDAQVAKSRLDDESAAIRDELRSLRERPSNIPAHNLGIRATICAGLGIEAQRIPFAGELIQVAAAHSHWEGAAERVLRSFGLSLLVPQDLYAQVADWVNAHHLGGKLVYYRVPARVSTLGDTAPDGALLYKLDLKEGPFEDWLERELHRRARHLCVDSMAEFRRQDWAVTEAGQIRTSGGRHEKDDSRRIDDRRHFVLGWSNEAKIEALLADAQRVQHELSTVTAALTGAEAERERIDGRRSTLTTLSAFDGYDELDWESVAAHISNLQARKRELEAASAELARIASEIERTEHAITDAEAARRAAEQQIARLEQDRERAQAGKVESEQILAEPAAAVASDLFAAIEKRLRGERPTSPAQCGPASASIERRLTGEVESLSEKARLAENRIVHKMGEFRRHYPLDTVEMDASVAAVGEYRALHERLTEDDLPRFEDEFKTYLNTNTIRDIAGFHSQLSKQVELIRTRIDTINDSLAGIDCNPGRFIRLEESATPNQEIREFREELRRCSDGSLGADTDDQYSEGKFLHVKSLIEKFRGREGQTDLDRAWTKRVTDVRNWCVFAASERYREDDTEHETYTDSGGKSGGQKEKLAYTILAASLAYQFNLQWGAVRSKDFRFAVIDEAFGRGSDDSTRYALSLFRKLGLQLLIVTPLQKIHVIESFVSSVGFVDNKTSKNSRLQCLTIEEYRERKRLHGLISLTQPDEDSAESA